MQSIGNCHLRKILRKNNISRSARVNISYVTKSVLHKQHIQEKAFSIMDTFRTSCSAFIKRK